MLQYVSTKYGQLEGTVSPRGYTLFKGVPYAAPPVGKMRWKPSVDPAPWDGIRACDQWGNACLQAVTMDDPTAGYGKEFYATGDYPPRMDEDCLYLNIWTPAQDPGEKLPVMMWIHGGGVQTGFSHELEFDGDGFCQRGVILVTVNYRLNIFGYFAHPELTLESPQGASGNYGRRCGGSTKTSPLSEGIRTVLPCSVNLVAADLRRLSVVPPWPRAWRTVPSFSLREDCKLPWDVFPERNWNAEAWIS